MSSDKKTVCAISSAILLALSSASASATQAVEIVPSTALTETNSSLVVIVSDEPTVDGWWWPY